MAHPHEGQILLEGTCGAGMPFRSEDRLVQSTLAAIGLHLVLLCGAACSEPRLPDVQSAADRFRDAVARGDAEQVCAMLREQDCRRLGARGVDEALRASGAEAQDRSRELAVGAKDARIEIEYWTVSREPVKLVRERDDYRVGLAGTLPAQPASPAQAVALLRYAISNRSYSVFRRILSRESLVRIESSLHSLADGLDDPRLLDVRVDGDRAEVAVPGGHRVWLVREGEVWKVEDFE